MPTVAPRLFGVFVTCAIGLFGTSFTVLAQSCTVRSSTDVTCTDSYTSCLAKNELAGCRSTRNECLKTGRWIWRTSSGCTDWGTRQKK